MSKIYDVAIVGSGFAGSILARALHYHGQRVLLLEKGQHPRFALGESTTPLANFALERLAVRYRMPDLWQLSTHGRWLRYRDDLRRGLKRGFTFYRHESGQPFSNSEANENRLLVAASPTDAVADTHWMRSDVDAHLVRQAALEGVHVFDRTEVDGVEVTDKGVVVSARAEGERMFFEVGHVVDATGPAAAVAKAAGWGELVERMPVKSGLLATHLEGAGNILRGGFASLAEQGGARLELGAYADEIAAVHHLVDEGWIYVLPFDHGPASVGIILATEEERSAAGVSPELAWRDILSRYPTLARQLLPCRTLRPITFVEHQQHLMERSVGERIFLLPHAYCFVDPMFSTGLAWSLLAVERLADILTGNGEWTPEDYSTRLRAEAERIAGLVDMAYRTRHDFAAFAAVSQLYFITVSFLEARQRLLPEDVVPPAWEGFLGIGDPLINDVFAAASKRVRGGQLEGFGDWLAAELAPRNIAGLADPGRRNLYPVDLDALVQRSALLGLERHEVEEALPRLRGEIDPPLDMTPRALVI